MTHLRECVPQDTRNVRVTPMARALRVRSTTTMREPESSHVRKRAKIIIPTRFSDTNLIDGGVFPWTVVVTTVVLVCGDGVGTSGDLSDVAVREPNLFVAVTVTRRPCPMSLVRTPYVVPVAPGIAAQLLPFWSQCCHCCRKLTAPLQVPSLEVSVLPTAAVPETVGRTVFTGGTESKTSVLMTSAEAPPSAFVAVTTPLIRRFASSFTSLYDCDVAPVMLAQLAPFESQRCHWYENFVGLFDHVPFEIESVSPTYG